MEGSQLTPLTDNDQIIAPVSADWLHLAYVLLTTSSGFGYTYGGAARDCVLNKYIATDKWCVTPRDFDIMINRQYYSDFIDAVNSRDVDIIFNEDTLNDASQNPLFETEWTTSSEYNNSKCIATYKTAVIHIDVTFMRDDGILKPDFECNILQIIATREPTRDDIFVHGGFVSAIYVHGQYCSDNTYIQTQMETLTFDAIEEQIRTGTLVHLSCRLGFHYSLRKTIMMRVYKMANRRYLYPHTGKMQQQMGFSWSISPPTCKDSCTCIHATPENRDLITRYKSQCDGAFALFREDVIKIAQDISLDCSAACDRVFNAYKKIFVPDMVKPPANKFVREFATEHDIMVEMCKYYVREFIGRRYCDIY